MCSHGGFLASATHVTRRQAQSIALRANSQKSGGVDRNSVLRARLEAAARSKVAAKGYVRQLDVLHVRSRHGRLHCAVPHGGGWLVLVGSALRGERGCPPSCRHRLRAAKAPGQGWVVSRECNQHISSEIDRDGCACWDPMILTTINSVGSLDVGISMQGPTRRS